MKKNKLKLLLDLVMLIVLVLMFKKTALSLNFHEIGGLALIGTFIFHLILNNKWISGVTKKLFSKTLPTKTKIGYVINALLLVSFLLIGLSGILISKVVFSFNVGGMLWKTIHYTAAAVSLVLMGAHLGLHAGFIKSVLSKRKAGQKRLAAVVGIILAVVITGYGCYSLATTSFVNWISMPFTASQMSGGGESHGAPPTAGTSTTASGSTQPGTPPSGMPSGHGDGGAGTISAATVVQTIGSYFSITFVFAVVTVLLEKAVTRRRVKREPIPVS